MWAVSSAFLAALTQSHTLASSCTLSTPGGSSRILALAGGSVAVGGGGSGLIRRTASLLLEGDSTLYKQLSTPGAVITLSHGIDFGGGVKELVPLIKGELSSAAKTVGEGTISASIADWGQRVEGSPFLTPANPAATAGRISTAAGAITGAVGVTVDSSRASDTATIGSSQVWTSRSEMVRALLTDAGAEGFFLPDGTFRIRDLPQTTDAPVWVFKTGTGGTIETFARNRPLDKLYNTVVVRPASIDSSQTWTQVIAQITDTANPRHPNYIGTRPLFWDSPTIMSASEAQTVAAKILNKVQGSTETIALGALSNPALEVGDVIRATDPTDAGTAIIQALLDSFALDLATGSMTLQTRAAVEAFT